MATFRAIDIANQSAKMSILGATQMRKRKQPLRIVAHNAIAIGNPRELTQKIKGMFLAWF